MKTIKLFCIFVVLILADRLIAENATSDCASAKSLISEITTEVIMFIPIPNFPNYQFNNETLEVKSLGRNVANRWGGWYKKEEQVLKPILNWQGYYYLSLCNENGTRTFRRSQICWLANKGELPSRGYTVDHIDADKANDRFGNLQKLTHRANCSKGCQENGTEYPTGVCWHKQREKYQAQITIGDKNVYLGLFVTVDEASNAYQKALAGLSE